MWELKEHQGFPLFMGVELFGAGKFPCIYVNCTAWSMGNYHFSMKNDRFGVLKTHLNYSQCGKQPF
jgi:hypothetical protein